MQGGQMVSIDLYFSVWSLFQILIINGLNYVFLCNFSIWLVIYDILYNENEHVKFPVSWFSIYYYFISLSLTITLFKDMDINVVIS